MRKVIDGDVYDTSLAVVSKKFTHGAPGDPCGYEETLYKTVDGKYFIYTYGGTKSKYPKEDIIPIDHENIKEWMMSR